MKVPVKSSTRLADAAYKLTRIQPPLGSKLLYGVSIGVITLKCPKTELMETPIASQRARLLRNVPWVT
jgi:hypothetical protein